MQRDDRISPGCLCLCSDANEGALGRVPVVLRALLKMPIASQPAHAGRKASSHAPWDGGQQARAPSALRHAEPELPPEAMDAAARQRLIDAFADAARRAHRRALDVMARAARSRSKSSRPLRPAPAYGRPTEVQALATAVASTPPTPYRSPAARMVAVRAAA